MTIEYLSVTDVSKRLGISTAAVSAYKLPQPDALIGRTRGATPRPRCRRRKATQTQNVRIKRKDAPPPALKSRKRGMCC